MMLLQVGWVDHLRRIRSEGPGEAAVASTAVLDGLEGCMYRPDPTASSHLPASYSRFTIRRLGTARRGLSVGSPAQWRSISICLCRIVSFARCSLSLHANAWSEP